MAKWCGGATVVGLYFLLSFCLINCSTSELEKVHKDSYSDVKYREVGGVTGPVIEYKNTNINALEQIDQSSIETNEIPEMKQKPLGASSTVSAGTAATPKNAFTHTKMGLNGDKIHEPDAESSNTDRLLINNFGELRKDYRSYYNSTIDVNEALAREYWTSFKNISANTLLSKSHRRAMTVQLSFDFPFYGHPVRNVTVSTGGFLHTGDYVHNWLAATKYIAPLMANFDTSLSNDSFVKLADNGTAFTVIWENVFLRDNEDIGSFTFSTTLHENGDIVFAYFSVPISIATILDYRHPVTVGISDSYIIDNVAFVRRKIIYQYHRVAFGRQEIQNSTIIILKKIY